MDHKKRHEEVILYKRYTPDEFPTYDNYDAINVDKVAHIPADWDGPMGVPITFLVVCRGFLAGRSRPADLRKQASAGPAQIADAPLDKWNPDQFEIVRFRKGDDGKDLQINGKSPFFRIVIKNRNL